MDNMCRLGIIDSTWEVSTQLLRYLDLPNLETFEYSTSIPRSYLNLHPILARLTAPHMLTSLSLSAPISTGGLIDCLRIFPMLQNLVFRQPRASLATTQPVVTCKLFSTLTPCQDLSATICPRLESLSCLGIDGGSDAELLALIQTRRTSGPHVQALSRVHVAFTRAAQTDIAPKLATLGAGLTAVLRYPSKEDIKFMARRRPEAASNPRREQDGWEADWGPLSCGWTEEYAEWGVSHNPWAVFLP